MIPSEIDKCIRLLVWPVFPIHVAKDSGEKDKDGNPIYLCTCGKPDCGSPGKHPRTMNGFTDATANRDQVDYWSERFGTTNWGLQTGKTKHTNILVIDVDPRHNGFESVEKLKTEGYTFPETKTHTTPGGGVHWLYDKPDGIEVQSKPNAFGPEYPGIDVKAEGGYVLIPPSVGPNGKPYAVSNSMGKSECPKWIFEKLAGRRSITESQQRGKFKLPQEIPAGARTTTLFSMARSLAMQGMSKEAVLEALKIENVLKCANPPMPEDKLKRAVEDAFNYETTVTKYVDPQPPGAPKSNEHPRLVIDLEPDNFYIVYHRYAELNKAPYPDYFHAGATAMLSVAVDRMGHLQGPARPIYPCLWTMLLGASTIAHKTDAIEPVDCHLWTSFSDKALPGHWSASGLFDELSLTPRGYLLKDECANILANINNNKEAGAARDLLMQIYECPETVKKKLSPKKGKEQNVWLIEKPYVTMLLATTPENFSQNTTALDVNSGWLLRFLYYYPNYKKQPVPFMFTNGEISDAERRMSERYRAIRAKIQEKGEFRFDLSDEGIRYFQTWQVRRELEIQENEQLTEQKVFGRLVTAALKLAMLFTVGSTAFVSKNNKTGMSVEIPVQYVIEACRQIDEYFMPMACSVIIIVERDVTQNVQDKIRAKLDGCNGSGCDRSDLMRYVRVKAREFDEHINTMIESCEISQESVNTAGRTKIMYKIT